MTPAAVAAAAVVDQQPPPLTTFSTPSPEHCEIGRPREEAHPLLLPYLTTSRQRAATPAENRPLLLLAVHLASEPPADQVRRQQLSVCV